MRLHRQKIKNYWLITLKVLAADGISAEDNLWKSYFSIHDLLWSFQASILS